MVCFVFQQARSYDLNRANLTINNKKVEYMGVEQLMAMIPLDMWADADMPELLAAASSPGFSF